MTRNIEAHAKEILLIVDIQNDFCSGGALAVPGGDEIVPLVNQLATSFAHVILTQDWHPRRHLSFASTHASKRPYETVMASYGPQILWPDHCVQETSGAKLHAGLEIPHVELILRKGYNHTIDSYSAFYENDHKTPTGLTGYLRERGFRKIYIAGLAFDFCVRYSAEDAKRELFDVVVIEDACRGIDVNGSIAKTRDAFNILGITCTTTDAIDRQLA
jgi:nicotinamidase/pyrazinamidase